MTTSNHRLSEIKKAIQARWSDFSGSDLDEVSADITLLEEKLKTRYQLSDAEATTESQRFSDAYDATYSLESNQQWREEGAPQVQEGEHPERAMIRKEKDNGRYGTADSAGELH